MKREYIYACVIIVKNKTRKVYFVRIIGMIMMIVTGNPNIFMNTVIYGDKQVPSAIIITIITSHSVGGARY